ncbi:hypothetical protein, partial [Bradyrhizobium sp.]|uniref:hypothetical protein n=1 Tax=Bradyrhizobium sp. TaxID=376 RepID=UPI003C74ABA9
MQIVGEFGLSIVLQPAVKLEKTPPLIGLARWRQRARGSNVAKIAPCKPFSPPLGTTLDNIRINVWPADCPA